MNIPLKGSCEQKNITNDILKATASSLISQSNVNNIINSYHNTVKDIIYNKDIIPDNVRVQDRYLYTYKENMLEDNGLINTNINNYNFTKSFYLNNKIYFLSNVYGIWYCDIIKSLDNQITSLGEIKQTNITNGSFYDYVFIDDNNVKVFGDSVILFNVTNNITSISIENNINAFSFITSVLPLNNGNIICGTYEAGIKIYNNLNVFEDTNINIGRITDIKQYNNKIYASSEYKGVYVSIDNGLTWTNTNIIDKTVPYISTTNNGLFVILYGSGIYKLDILTNTFKPTNIISKKFNFIKQTSQGIFAAGWATGIYKLDELSGNFVIFKKYSNEQYTDCLEIIQNNISNIYFLGSELLIYENNLEVKEQILGIGYTSLSYTDNYLFLFSQNNGIQYYDRNYYLKDKTEIRIFELDNNNNINYTVEPFKEGDRVVVLNSNIGKSIEYGLRNNYLVITEGSSNTEIDDNSISKNKTWSSFKINDEINTINNNIEKIVTDIVAAEVEPIVSKEVTQQISNVNINGGQIDGSDW